MASSKTGAAGLAAPPPTPDMENGTAAHVEQAPHAGAGEDHETAMFERFMALMERREQALLDQVDLRLQALRDSMPALGVQGQSRPHGDYAPHPDTQNTGGLIPPPGSPETARPIPVDRRLVAFIPREDALNPRATMFEAFLNGERIRIRRGQVGMVYRGMGIDLAKNHHGHVVDIEAMQSMTNPPPIEVQENPSFARPDDWDGLPLQAASSFTPPRIS